MVNWLQKLLPPSGPANKTGSRSLPVQMRPGPVTSPNPRNPLPPQTRLPNAALIYGVAAAALFAVSLYFLFTGRFFTALLVLLPAGCFLGFALHFTKHYSGGAGR